MFYLVELTGCVITEYRLNCSYCKGHISSLDHPRVTGVIDFCETAMNLGWTVREMKKPACPFCSKRMN